MTTRFLDNPSRELRPALAVFSRNWGWYIALGAFQVLAGCLAVAWPVTSTLTAVYVFGWLLIGSGVGQVLAAIGSRRWGGFLLTLVSGVLSLVVGIMALRHPGTMDLALTMLVATLLLVSGGFRLLAAVLTRFYGWQWTAVGGLVSALLGGYIYATLPVASFWVLGTFLGIELLSTGWTWIFFGSAARTVRAAIEPTGPHDLAPAALGARS